MIAETSEGLNEKPSPPILEHSAADQSGQRQDGGENADVADIEAA